MRLQTPTVVAPVPLTLSLNFTGYLFPRDREEKGTQVLECPWVVGGVKLKCVCVHVCVHVRVWVGG